MPSPAAYTIYAFGIASFVAGLQTFLSPHSSLQSFELPIAALPALKGNGLAATAMGIYYTLAARQENKSFFLLTIPMRLVAAITFSQFDGTWKLAAFWEGGGALLTAVALGWDSDWRTGSRNRRE
ncbi:hypothetical protein Slin15195_G026100 [Septoria linicola]|uniref:Uncharacterized protein n=1 Tax=Septoria linicola TaxID=215465 RepID=A0A9Q9EEZ2_9PEZI|nr:hypothetical protein Slin15195_G026100 [Septoria linicola]